MGGGGGGRRCGLEPDELAEDDDEEAPSDLNDAIDDGGDVYVAGDLDTGSLCGIRISWPNSGADVRFDDKLECRGGWEFSAVALVLRFFEE